MKKILPIFVVGILVLSGLGAVSIANYTNYDVKKESVVISEPIIQEIGQYATVDFKGSTLSLSYPGEPVLPIVTKVFTFPFGSKINSVDVSFSTINKCTLSKEVQPAPEPVPMDSKLLNTKEPVKDEMTYNSKGLYPSEGYDYNVGSGLDGKNHVIFLTVQCYPVRYSPAKNMIYYSKNFDITVTYEKPAVPTVFPDEHDLVIIAPEKFSADLQPLVDHKNNIGVKTILKTTEDIYSEYSGVDKPEQIKYFIKDALDTWGIKYVLLVGGLNSLIYAQRRDDCNQGSNDWFVPVRYTNLRMSGAEYDPGFISDLYYADIYDGEGNFSSWDSNGDGVFAAWKFGLHRDTIDLYPDVYVGRLPCRNTNEVKTMVGKIINYESSTCDPSWFNKMVVAGGNTFDTDISEGEVANQKALDYMNGFEPVKLWASNKDTGGPVPEPETIIKTVSEGCGFLYFAGHGSPELWYTYYSHNPVEKVNKFLWYDTYKLSNGNKLPVCVVGSCHGSQFNVTALSFINLWLNKIAKKFNLDFLERWPGNCAFPTPECFDWALTKVKGGGTISTIGNTGIGYGATGNNGDLDGDGIDDPDCIEKFGGYLETLFFKEYGVENTTILGETYGHAITDYLHVYPGMHGQTDCKTVEQWELFGDPSLEIGGHS